MSKNQAARLGERLATGRATDQDWDLYAEILDCYDQNTTLVRSAVDATDWTSVLGRAVDLAVTARTKTLGTLIDKLARTPAVKLPAIRDISGVRIVGDLLLSEQDRIAEHLIRLFDCPDAKPVDRRAQPASGYRALHVVIVSDGLPVEVQIRTELQALWADLYERLADTWGRQIRYGEPPTPVVDGDVAIRAEFVAELQALSVDAFAATEGARQQVASLVGRLDQLNQAVNDPEGNALVPVEEDFRKQIEEAASEVQSAERATAALHEQMKARLAALAEVANRLS